MKLSPRVKEEYDAILTGAGWATMQYIENICILTPREEKELARALDLKGLLFDEDKFTLHEIENEDLIPADEFRYDSDNLKEFDICVLTTEGEVKKQVRRRTKPAAYTIARRLAGQNQGRMVTVAYGYDYGDWQTVATVNADDFLISKTPGAERLEAI